jgi:hypothetical protein
MLRRKNTLTTILKSQLPATGLKRHLMRRQSGQQSGGTLSGRTNGSIDEWYGCFSFEML